VGELSERLKGDPTHEEEFRGQRWPSLCGGAFFRQGAFFAFRKDTHEARDIEDDQVAKTGIFF
jgi:hypothetical protein